MSIFFSAVISSCKLLQINQSFTSVRCLSFAMVDSTIYREVFDAHCHLHYNVDKSVEIISKLSQVKFAIMSTRPDDWPHMNNLYERFPLQIQPAIGVHPWFAHKIYATDWLLEMRSQLLGNRKMIVGEIGLDKHWIPPDSDKNEIDLQVAVFNNQLDLATELNRPISVHSVRSDGLMYDLLASRTELPPKIYFHAFGGTSATARSYYKMKRYGERFYFGFASVINLRSPKTLEVIRSIPDDRLLLESDLEDPTNVADSLNKMIEVIAACKGWDISTACRVTTENANRFYSILP